jgi:hypothetical protein
MKRIVRLTESDLTRIVKKILKEQNGLLQSVDIEKENKLNKEAEKCGYIGNNAGLTYKNRKWRCLTNENIACYDLNYSNINPKFIIKKIESKKDESSNKDPYSYAKLSNGKYCFAYDYKMGNVKDSEGWAEPKTSKQLQTIKKVLGV